MSKIQNLPSSALAAPADLIGGDPLDAAVERGTAALLAEQRPDGHWAFELEADATIPAEYVLLRHFLGEPDPPEREARFARYLRRLQSPEHGGWPLFHGGALDVSCSVKAYFALKLIGDDPEAPHMRRAREAIRAAGGAARCNVFTRIALALFGEVPWRAVPVMPPEIMLLPRWFPFHIAKISYWARTVLVPLLVVQAHRPRAVNPRGVSVRELFLEPPEKVRRWPGGEHEKEPWATLFRALDRVLQPMQHLFPAGPRRRAEALAEQFVTERLNGEDGLGAIFPAMVNALLMYRCLGIPEDDPRPRTARAAIEKLVTERADGEIYVQPCLSPVWDTALACHALMETGDPRAEKAARDGLRWLLPRQVLDVVGDWAWQRPGVRPGGWAFQYANPHYPDVDDTAVAVLALDRARSTGLLQGAEVDTAIDRATEWIRGVQSRSGGWGAFDADNEHHALNNIPFSDHGALLDPPTADVTGRCLAMLAKLGNGPEDPVVARATDWLLREQEPDGSWFGRWGVNYVYGTWSVVTALNAAGLPPDAPPMRRAVAWLKSRQNPDGGWGEDGASYALHRDGRPQASPSTASQTAWALLALMAAGAVDDPAVERGMAFLLRTQQPDGTWPEEAYTGTGFPRVFYLRYHGYRQIFPVWALARLRALKRSNSRTVPHGL